MKVVYSSPRYYVVEYPTLEAFELVNRTSGFRTLICGDVAARFRVSLEIVIAQEPSTEEFDDFLGGYGRLMTEKVVIH